MLRYRLSLLTSSTEIDTAQVHGCMIVHLFYLYLRVILHVLGRISDAYLVQKTPKSTSICPRTCSDTLVHNEDQFRLETLDEWILHSAIPTGCIQIEPHLCEIGNSTRESDILQKKFKKSSFLFCREVCNCRMYDIIVQNVDSTLMFNQLKLNS